MITLRLWPRMNGWLACWWEPNRSAPYDVKWAPTLLGAIARLDLEGVA